MSKKIVLINSNIKDVLERYFENKDVEIIENVSDCDLIVYDGYYGELPDNAINVHPSLLPAFNCEDAAKEAFLAGVKVSGVTIHSKDKIIAQYPVLIGVDTHIDEFEKDLCDVKKRLLPPVIESILEDKVFDFSDLFRNPCHCSDGGCSSCGKCN